MLASTTKELHVYEAVPARIIDSLRACKEGALLAYNTFLHSWRVLPLESTPEERKFYRSHFYGPNVRVFVVHRSGISVALPHGCNDLRGYLHMPIGKQRGGAAHQHYDPCLKPREKSTRAFKEGVQEKLQPRRCKKHVKFDGPNYPRTVHPRYGEKHYV